LIIIISFYNKFKRDYTMSEEFSQIEDFHAYAKLEGINKKYFLNKLNIFLGRDVSKDEDPNEQIIFLADSQKISRKHAKIYWDSDQCCWFIQNLSKNKTIVNGKSLKKDDPPFQLIPQSAIRIDRIKFYFFPAFEEKKY